jgi:HlyD family secretion protein
MKNILTTAILIIIALACSNDNGGSDAFGNFEAETVIISAESSGKIILLNVEEGKKVDEGSVAAVIDSVQLHLKLEQIEAQKQAVNSGKNSILAQIEILEEQKKNLLKDKRRIEDMLKDRAATQKQMDDITGQIAVTDKQIAHTRTQIISVNKELGVLETQRKATEDLLNRCTVESPVGGTVLETYAEQGELAAPGKPIYKMANLDEMILKVYISGAQLPAIKIGQTVDVIVDKSAKENQTFKGKVAWISSEAEFTPKIIQTKEERVKLVYAVKIRVKNDGTLKIGMPGEIKW